MPGFKLIREFFEDSIKVQFEALLDTVRSPDKHDDSDLIRGQIRGIRFVFSIDKMITQYEANKKQFENMKGENNKKVS